MKARFINWLKFLIVTYIPSSSQLAALEATRLSKFLTENYDCNQQLIVLEELKNHIIEFRKDQIVKKREEIERNQGEEVLLQQNLEKLIAE